MPYIPPSSPRPIRDRFFEKVEIGASDECWRWKGKRVRRTTRSGTSQGQFMWKIENGVSKFILAHRAAYILEIGEIPEGFNVKRTCHNQLCVNPKHLMLAKDTINRDVVRAQHPDFLRTDENIDRVVELFKSGLGPSTIARKIPMSRTTVYACLKSRGINGRRFSDAKAQSENNLNTSAG